ncbi:putative chaplin protein [Streptomyces sp. NBRC 110611]|uniref:chaplin n=1 Tax=Streptomyces sp. NBRC 110611 TaxID=1621259 RepID=UPI000835D396|nr:chaplin [Streptomyces sp. NBRC 110611]GAU68496.1 putative chaplin protein [Streptomyces sp. NBRC 110611]
MKNIKRAAAITLAASGLALAGAGVASADTPQAAGQAVNNPGIVSGNLAQTPLEADTNVTGNTINGAGVLNPASGNASSNAH